MKQPGDIIPKQFRNCGYSLGLKYPYIYAHDLEDWIVWHRETGIVASVERSEGDADTACHMLNGLSKTPDAATLEAIDQTP